MSADKCCCCATKFDNSEGFGKFTSVFKCAGCACVLARENIVRIYKRQGAENVSGRLRKRVRKKCSGNQLVSSTAKRALTLQQKSAIIGVKVFTKIKIPFREQMEVEA